jgi:hypothetical protein
MGRVIYVMALTFCVAGLVAVVSPAYAGFLLQENFDEPGAGNPGTALVNAGSGWTGSAVPYLSNFSSIDSGNCLEWRANGGSGWQNVAHSFSDTPSAGDTYTLTATLFANNTAGSNASLYLADSSSEHQYVGVAIGYGSIDGGANRYFKWENGEGAAITATPSTWDYGNGIDVKIVLTDSLQDFYYRANGTTTWTSAGSLTTSLPLSTYKAVTMDVNPGYTGAIDSIALSTSAVPEPSAIVLLITGLIGLLTYVWRKRTV